MNNNVAQAVSANGIGVVLLVVLLLNFYRKFTVRNGEQKVFAAMLFASLSQCVVEGATFLVDGKHFAGDVIVSLALNTCLFLNFIFYAFLWAVYAEVRVNRRIQKGRLLLMAIPVLAVVAGVVVNLFKPVFFRITPDNWYVREDGFILTYAVAYVYLLLGTLSAYRSRNQGERYVILPALTFLTPVVVASIIQFFCQGIALMWVGAAIGMNSAFISLVDEGASVDQLSGAFSRHQLNEALHRLPHRASTEKPVAGLMMDIDDFKAINDKYGHLMGDDAIRTVGHLLRRAAQGYGKVYRYAGDEFTIIIPLVKGPEIHQVEARIQAELDAVNQTTQQPYRLSLSTGHTIYQHGEAGREFIRRMDEAMYQQKAGSSANGREKTP